MDAEANILRTDMAFELRLLHQHGRLFPSPAQKEGPTRGVDAVGQIFNSSYPCGIDGGHISES